MLTLENARKWYPATDPVHGFDHIQRVYAMAQRIGDTIAGELAADTVSRAAHAATFRTAALDHKILDYTVKN